MRLLTGLLAAILAVSFLIGASTCKMTPESQRTVEEELSVPGLEESLIARDRAIAAAIVMSLHADVELMQNKLQVECHSGKVILRGKVPSEELKERAEKLARAQEGVKDVLNEIEVDESLQDSRISLDEF